MLTTGVYVAMKISEVFLEVNPGILKLYMEKKIQEI